MAFRFLTNFQGTGPQCIYQLKELLKGPSNPYTWSVTSSGDGLSAYSATTDIIYSGSGSNTPNGLGNTNAWFVIQMPAVNGVSRQLCFQRGTLDQNWRVKYSCTGFTGGSPNATTPPTALDEKYLLGDALPTFSALFTTNASWFQAGVDDAAPYGFYAVAYAVTGRAIQTAIILDPTTGVSGDADPYVFNVSCGNGTPLAVATHLSAANTHMNVETGNVLKAFLNKGLTGEGWTTVFACTIGTFTQTNQVGANIFPYGTLVNTTTGFDDVAPIPYARRNTMTAPVGFKGISTMMQWPGVPRNTADTMSSRTRIILGAVSLPWNGTTTPQ